MIEWAETSDEEEEYPVIGMVYDLDIWDPRPEI